MGNCVSKSSKVYAATKDHKYYEHQADLYFNTLQTKPLVLPERPNYASHVIRWEWPPWLLLTGRSALGIRASDDIIRTTPCICVDRTHKYFSEHPFARSIVTFYYFEENVKEMKNPIRIYEEFTFNSKGEIVFIGIYIYLIYFKILSLFCCLRLLFANLMKRMHSFIF